MVVNDEVGVATHVTRCFPRVHAFFFRGTGSGLKSEAGPNQT
jgi:hypothetical protein